MVVMRQILSGELQSQQQPVVAHGVLYLRRLALGGEAHSLTRLIASSTVPSTSLLRPATTITFFGPKNIDPARFPVASIFTRIPARVKAFVPERNKSQVSCLRMISKRSSG